MKTLAAICCAAALACAMAGCNGKDDMAGAPAAAPDTHEADVKAIGDIEAQWNKDYAARDVDKITAHYASDAVLMVPDMPAVEGTDAIRKDGEEMFKDPAMSLEFKPMRIEASGKVAYSQGTYVMHMTDPKTHKVMEEHGTFVTTYGKQADGAWKAEADIATPSGPAMPMAAAKKM